MNGKYNQKLKRKFRSSKAWSEFRHVMYERAERKCAVTGSRLTKLWQLHHMDLREENYEKLDPENFVCLSWNMHKVVHMLFVKSRPREWRARLLRLIPILKRMEQLLKN